MSTPKSRVELVEIIILKFILSYLAAYIAYSILRAIYNITLHPLAKFPGPKIDSAFDFARHWYSVGGDSAARFSSLHDQYGKCVRVAPNRLSFNSAQAFTDIHATKTSDRYPMKKDPGQYEDLIDPSTVNIITSDTATHKKQRKVISYAFSPSALRDQEDIIHSYCALLITRLQEQIHSPSKGKVDISRWLNFTTFDILGDLAFAESFHCLDTGENSVWMTALFQNLKTAVYLRSAMDYPVLKFLFHAVIKYVPGSVEVMKRLNRDANDKMKRRLEAVTDRKDFTSHFIKHNNGAMTNKDLVNNASIFIIAGSETSATLLSGLTFLLLTNPEWLDKVRAEIDNAFRDPSEMTFVREGQLPLLQACIEETLRVYPPLPMELNRVTPPSGAIVDGLFVPGNKVVAVSQLGAYHSALNFKDPLEFHPERFLGDKRYASDDLAALQPFSVGPRNCVGVNLAYAEIRGIATRVLWHFDLELCPESERWMDQKVYFLWDKKPLMVKLTSRDRW